MKALKSNVTNGLSHGSYVEVCDNSGAKVVRIISFKRAKTVKRRQPAGGVAAMVNVSVRKGSKEMRKQVVPAIIVRQKMPYRRADGTRIKFEDNAVVILKDDKGTPKGTIFKGAIAKEAADRWPAISKIASIVV